MALVLKVGSVDLSPYVRVAHEDGLDPANPEYSEPQFTGAPALGEGKSFVGDAVDNPMESYPLLLSAADTDALHALIQTINAELVQGRQVEFRSSNASRSTFFDLERGRLEEKYEFWLDQSAYVRAMLHLWCRPYGHTGTYRGIVPSVAATGPQTLQATGVLGDALAQVHMRVDTTPSYLASHNAPQMIAYGISQSPSYVGVWRGASLIQAETFAESSIVGASGAVASQYRGTVASPHGDQSVSYLYLSGDRAIPFEGRQRLLLVARTRVALDAGAPAIGIFDSSENDQKLIASVVATHSTQWKVYDCGEWSVPPASGLSHAARALSLTWHSTVGSTASLIASPALQISALMMIPLDVSAGIHLADGWGYPNFPYPDPHLIFSPGHVTRKTATDSVLRDESAKLRGAYPMLPPTGSPAASGALSIVFAAGDPTNFVGNKPVGLEIDGRERFTYLR